MKSCLKTRQVRGTAGFQRHAELEGKFEEWYSMLWEGTCWDWSWRKEQGKPDGQGLREEWPASTAWPRDRLEDRKSRQWTKQESDTEGLPLTLGLRGSGARQRLAVVPASTFKAPSLAAPREPLPYPFLCAYCALPWPSLLCPDSDPLCLLDALFHHFHRLPLGN